MNEQWTIPTNGGHSKANWTPYAGRQVRGSVTTVVIRGTRVYEDGQFLIQPGFGQNVRLISLAEDGIVKPFVPIAGATSTRSVGVDVKTDLRRISPERSPELG